MWSKGWPNSKTKMSNLAPSLDYVTNGTTEENIISARRNPQSSTRGYARKLSTVDTIYSGEAIGKNTKSKDSILPNIRSSKIDSL
jgi:hypothetical protein